MKAHTEDREASGKLTIGLDLGDRKSHYCVLDQGGTVIEEGSVQTSPASMEKHFSQYPHSVVALEVSTHSRWVSQLLQRLGHEALVANSNKVKLIVSVWPNTRLTAERRG
jgi:transposase